MSKNEFDLDLIPKNDQSETTNAINQAYSDLYNSLGVEPGLLSKTPIGRNLNKKFHNDNLDAQLYVNQLVQHSTSSKKDVQIIASSQIESYSPLKQYEYDLKPNHSEIVYTNNTYNDLIEYNLSGVLEFYKNEKKINDNELLQELKSFIEKNFNYTVIEKGIYNNGTQC